MSSTSWKNQAPASVAAATRVIASAAKSAGLAAMPCRDGLAAASVTFVSPMPERRGGIVRPHFCRAEPHSLHRGLTGTGRPLYSAGFATGPRPVPGGPCGGTGRRARLKIEFRKECWFDSGQGHQYKNVSNNNDLRLWFDSGL